MLDKKIGQCRKSKNIRFCQPLRAVQFPSFIYWHTRSSPQLLELTDLLLQRTRFPPNHPKHLSHAFSLNSAFHPPHIWTSRGQDFISFLSTPDAEEIIPAVFCPCELRHWQGAMQLNNRRHRESVGAQTSRKNLDDIYENPTGWFRHDTTKPWKNGPPQLEESVHRWSFLCGRCPECDPPTKITPSGLLLVFPDVFTFPRHDLSGTASPDCREAARGGFFGGQCRHNIAYTCSVWCFFFQTFLDILLEPNRHH